MYRTEKVTCSLVLLLLNDVHPSNRGFAAHNHVGSRRKMAAHMRNYVGKDSEGSSRPYPEIRFDFVHITIVMNHTITIRLKPLKK